MKRCVYCGKEYSDDASVCVVDAQPLKMIIPTLPEPLLTSVSERQQMIDREHIKLLSVFHFVVAGLAFVGVIFLFLHYLLMSSVFSNPDLWKSQKNAAPPPQDFLKVFVWFYIFMGVVLVTACTLNLLSGVFLRQRRHRVFSIVVGGLNCVQIPFGTVLGIFTLIVLMRDSVSRMYVARDSNVN